MLAALMLSAGCQNVITTPALPPELSAGALIPSARLVVGRILSVNPTQQFAFVELAADAPEAAVIPGTELQARTLQLQDTGRIQVSRYLRGRTLGTRIVGGQPSPGDEVVWLAP